MRNVYSAIGDLASLPQEKEWQTRLESMILRNDYVFVQYARLEHKIMTTKQFRQSISKEVQARIEIGLKSVQKTPTEKLSYRIECTDKGKLSKIFEKRCMPFVSFRNQIKARLLISNINSSLPVLKNAENISERWSNVGSSQHSPLK